MEYSWKEVKIFYAKQVKTCKWTTVWLTVLLYPPPSHPHHTIWHTCAQTTQCNQSMACTHTYRQAQIIILLEMFGKVFFVGSKLTCRSTLLSIACLLLNNEPINTVNVLKSILVNKTTNRMAKWTRHIDVCSYISSMVWFGLVCPKPRYRLLHFERKTDTPYVIRKVLWN